MRTRRRLALSLSIPAALAFGGAALARTPPPAAAAVPPAAPDFVRTCSRSSPRPASAATVRRSRRASCASTPARGCSRAASTAPCSFPAIRPRAPSTRNRRARPDSPHAEGERPLPAAEIDTIRRWIEAGAPWPPGVVVADASRAASRPAAAGPRRPGSVSFNRDVRPILVGQLLRLPRSRPQPAQGRPAPRHREAAKAASSGSRAIVPGKPDESELVARVSSPEMRACRREERQDALSAAQIAVLRRWIAEGAEYRSRTGRSSAQRARPCRRSTTPPGRAKPDRPFRPRPAGEGGPAAGARRPTG